MNPDLNQTPASLAIQRQNQTVAVLHFLDAYGRWRDKFDNIDFDRGLNPTLNAQVNHSMMNLFWNLQFDQFLLYKDSVIDRKWMLRWFSGRRYDWHFGTHHSQRIQKRLHDSPMFAQYVHLTTFLSDNQINPFEVLETLLYEYETHSYEKGSFGLSKADCQIRQHLASNSIVQLCYTLNSQLLQPTTIDFADDKFPTLDTAELAHDLMEIRRSIIRTEFWRTSWRNYVQHRIENQDSDFSEFVRRLDFAMINRGENSVRLALSDDFPSHGAVDTN